MRRFIILISLFISCINVLAEEADKRQVASTDEHASVDLGLTSGTLWATCNIGAESSTDVGDYYAWGETRTKTSFSWSNYSLCDGTSKYFTKYSTNRGCLDYKTTLESSDDVATVKWGNKWTMPSLAQIKELVSECVISFSISSLGDMYWILTGPNGNTITFPQSGDSDVPSFQASEIWSKELLSDTQSMAYTLLLTTSKNKCCAYISNRYVGMPIRPVVKSKGGSDYNPSNPDNPQAVVEKKALYLDCSPKGSCSFNITSGTKFQSGTNVYVASYNYSGYTFEGWYEGDSLVGSSHDFYYMMPNHDVTLQARYKYDPSNPGNPSNNGQSDVDNRPTLVTSILLNKKEINMMALEHDTLYATVFPSDASYPRIEWKSSNENVARVDENGVVTAIVGGMASIMANATDGSGVSAICSVNVTNPIFRVIYIVNGVEYRQDSVAYSSPIADFPMLQKEGYTFSGWGDVPTTMPAHDIFLYGSFTINKHSLTYMVDDVVVSDTLLEYNTPIAAIEEPKKEGYTFSGWSEIPEALPDSDVVVKGYFTINQYKVEFISNDSTLYSEMQDYATAINKPADPVKEGHTFIGWYPEVDNAVPSHDVTYTAQFLTNSYVLTYMLNDDVYKQDRILYGAQLSSIEDIEKEGYTFSGWSVQPETMPAHDVVISATLTVNQYKLNYIVDGDTISTSSIDYGTALSPINDPTREGYTFNGWSEVPETMPAHDVVVNGSFTINTYYAIYMVGGSIVNKVEVTYGDAMPEYTYAPEDERYIFEGWTGEEYETMPAHDVVYIANVTDDIRGIMANEDNSVYTMNGVKIGTTTNLKHLTQGIYIINGKKYIKK